MIEETPSGTTAERRAALELFELNFRRETHVLARRPDVVWQQLQNRLRWEERLAARLERELERRSGPGAAPWMRLETPWRESEELLATMAPDQGALRSCAFSPDGSLIVSASEGETLTVWDAHAGIPLRKLSGGHVARTGSACAFSPDGRRIVAGGHYGDLTVWDPASGGVLATLEGHTEQVRACAFSSDCSLIVSASADLAIWEPEGSYSQSSPRDDTGVRGVRHDPSWAVSGVGSLRIWDAESGAPVATLEASPTEDERRPIEVLEERRSEIYASDTTEETKRLQQLALAREYAVRGVWACAFSPDGRRIASASTDGTVKTWDVATATELRTLAGHAGTVHQCAFSPDGRLVASASTDGTLKLWDVESGTELRAFAGHAEPVRSCAFDPGGGLIVSASDDETLRAWDVEGGTELRAILGHGGPVRSCAFSRDGRVVVSASDDGTLKLWDARRRFRRRGARATPAGHSGPVRDCAYSPDGSLIVSASDDGTLRLWDAESGAEVRTLAGHDAAVASCGFSPDGGRICSASGSTLIVWDVATGEPSGRFESESGEIHACAFSPDGRDVACANHDATIAFWDADGDLAPVTLDTKMRTREGYEHAVARGTLALRSFALSPGGEQIAATRDDLYLQIWNVESGEVEYPGGHTTTFSCAFSPDGRRLVTGGSALKLWDPADGAEIRTFGRHAGFVSACAFTPDGARIIAVDESRMVEVWDLDGAEALLALGPPSRPSALAAHPWLPRLAFGDVTGAIYRVELIEISHGPIVVTACDHGDGPHVRCPACRQDHSLAPAALASVIACPTAGCDTLLRVNRFVVDPRNSRTSRQPPPEPPPDIDYLLSRQDPYG